MAATFAPFVVVVPSRYAPARQLPAVYLRRRVLVALVLLAVAVATWLGVGSVLANRGGDPASAPTVRPASSSQVYVAQEGDTMWSLAQRFRGTSSADAYLDALIAANGGTSIAIGQAITLP